MLRVDAALDRVPSMDNRPQQHLTHVGPSRDHDLTLHQINISDHLGHGMLHLDTRVHLDEVQATVLIHQEFDCSRVRVSDCRQ